MLYISYMIFNILNFLCDHIIPWDITASKKGGSAGDAVFRTVYGTVVRADVAYGVRPALGYTGTADLSYQVLLSISVTELKEDEDIRHIGHTRESYDNR